MMFATIVTSPYKPKSPLMKWEIINAAFVLKNATAIIDTTIIAINVMSIL